MGKSIDTALKLAEKHAEKEASSKIGARMRASVQDIGHVDGLRATILSFVAGENYQRAIDEMHIYIAGKHDYPEFAFRVERYIEYATDLINGIKAKRSFPGMQYLSSTKQQELYDRAMGHFEDLQNTLKKVEQIEHRVRLDDVRSTVWVVQAAVYSILGILVIAFVLEISHGMFPAIVSLADDGAGKIADWIFSRVGM